MYCFGCFKRSVFCLSLDAHQSHPPPFPPAADDRTARGLSYIFVPEATSSWALKWHALLGGKRITSNGKGDGPTCVYVKVPLVTNHQGNQLSTLLKGTLVVVCVFIGGGNKVNYLPFGVLALVEKIYPTHVVVKVVSPTTKEPICRDNWFLSLTRTRIYPVVQVIFVWGWVNVNVLTNTHTHTHTHNHSTLVTFLFQLYQALLLLSPSQRVSISSANCYISRSTLIPQ